MSKRVKKLIKQVTALFLALTIVMSFALTASSDRVLHATALDEEEAAAPVASVSEAEAENLAFTSESISVPAEPEPEPAPAAEIPIVAEAPAVIPEPEPASEPEPAAESEAGAEPDFRIVRRPEGRYVSIREKLMPYSEVVDMAMGADILVDYSLNPTSGLSLRPMEALFFGKKLITNNSEILSADFYSPSNIYVLGHDNRTLREFVECPGTEVLPEVRDGYLLSSWLKRFDESL